MRKNNLFFQIFILIWASIAVAADTPPSLPQIKFPAPPATSGTRKAGKEASRPALPTGGFLETDPSEPQPDTYNIQTAPPEAPTPVVLSSSDLNRISCGDHIQDALASAEKGAIIKIVGKDAFVKFSVLKTPEGKIKYTTTPTEIFVVCGDSTYNLIAYPKKVSSKTIRLGSATKNRIKENQSIYASLPFEKKILRAIKDVYTEQMPESYLVSKVDRPVGKYKEFSITHRRSIQIEGEGLTLHEFNLQLKPGQIEFKLNEKLFVNKTYAPNIVAICPERHILYPGETTRLFVVEQRSEKNGGGVTSLKLEEEFPEKNEQKKDLPVATSKPSTIAKGEEGTSHEN